MIDPQALRTVFIDCLYRDEELPAGGGAPDDAIIIQGVMSTFGLHPERLETHRDEVRAWLENLPDPFWASRGGGWSFLNLCTDRDDNLWTGLHTACEQLCVLAIGLGLGSFPLPREVWGALPGGVPYFIFRDTPDTKDAS